MSVNAAPHTVPVLSFLIKNMHSQNSNSFHKPAALHKIWPGFFATAMLAELFVSESAMAQVPSGAKKDADDWQFTLGAGVGYFADYEGSDDYDVAPLPLIGISWRDTVSVGSVDGPPSLKVKFLKIKGPTPKDRLVLSTSLGYFFGRDQDDNVALGGLGDLDGGVTMKLSADYRIKDFGAGVSIGRDLSGDREGTTLTATARYSFALDSPRTQLTLGTSATWADDNYMENIIGISAAQAAASMLGYAAHNAALEFKDVVVNVSIRHFWSRNVAITGMLGYKRLLGDAADSPIVDGQGSSSQISVLTGVSYRW